MHKPARQAVTGADSRHAYEAWHEAVHVEDARADRPWHELLFGALRARDLEAMRVLEIGSGRGELARAVAAGPAVPRHYVAADFAHTAVSLGRRRTASVAGARITWMVADIQHVPLADATVDTVISCETLEHLPDPRAALAELFRVLRPGGRLLLTTPNYLGPYGLYRGYLRLTGRRYTEGGQPISRFMLLPRTRSWIRQAGFRVVSWDACGHYVLWPGTIPWEPQGLRRFGRWLRPFGLHSIVVADKP